MKNFSRKPKAAISTEQHSKLWLFGPFITLPLLVAVSYGKIASVREVIDARVPWVKTTMARFSGSSKPIAAVAVPLPEPIAAQPPAKIISEPAPEPQVMPQPESTPAPPKQDETVDIGQLSANRAEWPKTITLKKAVNFPAVVNGKVMGRLDAPAGSSASMVLIRDGKVGVEYRGGGALIDPNDTDLIERVQAARRSRSSANLNPSESQNPPTSPPSRRRS